MFYGIVKARKILRNFLTKRSSTKAVGAQALTNYRMDNIPLGKFVGRLNLQDDFLFGSEANEHSAQFNRPIQRQMIPFYTALVLAAADLLSP